MSGYPSVTSEVVARFDGLRKRYVASWIVRECAIWLTATSLAWIAFSVSDYLWEWPLLIRRMGAAMLVMVLLSCIGYRASGIISVIKRKRFAALLEGQFAGFGQRLRTVLEVIDGRVRGPQEMLAALGHQTLGRWETVVPAKIVPQRQMWLAVAAAFIAAVSILGLLSVGEWRIAMLRAIGSDRSFTSFEVAPRDTRVIEDEPITVSLALHGRTNRSVTLRYRFVAPPDELENDWREIDLLAQEPKLNDLETEHFDVPPTSLTTATFVAELGKAVEAVEYQFVTSAGATAVYRIDVEPLIDAIEVRAVVKSPEYTQLEPREFQQPDVSALQGSEVELFIVTNHPLVKAQLLVGPRSSQLKPMELAQVGPSSRWSFKLPTSNSIRWRFEGEGRDAVPLTPVNGKLRIRRDEPPEIHWRGPADELQVHTLTELPMEVAVSDDYGLTEAGIVFELGDEDEFILTQWSASPDPTREGEVNLKLDEILPLESFGLTERDYVAYHAYAVDNRGGAPRRSESDVRYIDIRPLRQFYAEGEPGNGGGGLGGGFSTSVGEIIQRQRFLMNKTRRLVSSSTPLDEQLGTIDGLVASQSELAGFARFLIDRLAAAGRDDNEALAIAETAMLQAADSLAVGNFDLALTQQEEAMRALVEARNSLREIAAGQLNGQQRQALSRLLQQLNQKLRRTPAASDRALADSIQRLAQEQLDLGATVAGIVSERTVAAVGTSEANPNESVSSPAKDDAISDDADIATFEERLAVALDDQLALLARLQEIGDSLSEEILESELVTGRLTASLAALGKLADELQADELDDFELYAREAADELAELAVLIEALSQNAAVDRLPSIAELAASLAAMEQEIAGALTAEPLSGSDHETDTSNRPIPSSGDLPNRARQMLVRSQTLQEVLRLPANAADDSAIEVAERVAKWLEENGLLESLRESDDFSAAMAETTSENQGLSGNQGHSEAEYPKLAEAARERAADIADAALQLEAIYRQLVTPQLARLREIEDMASRLEQRLADAEEEAGDLDVELRELDLSMRTAGLTDIAEILMGGEPEGSEAGGGLGGRLHVAADLLRQRIQQLVLQGIAADRDAPVPLQYRTLVDRYFQVLSGASFEADHAEVTP